MVKSRYQALQDDQWRDDEVQDKDAKAARVELSSFEDDVDRAMREMWAAHQAFPKPVSPPFHFNFKLIEYRIAQQITALDTLFWSLSNRGVGSDSAETGSMAIKLALAAQNQCRTTYLALVARYGRAASEMSRRDPLPSSDAEPEGATEPSHASME